MNPTRQSTGCGVRQVAKIDGDYWYSLAIWIRCCVKKKEEEFEEEGMQDKKAIRHCWLVTHPVVQQNVILVSGFVSQANYEQTQQTRKSRLLLDSLAAFPR